MDLGSNLLIKEQPSMSCPLANSIITFRLTIVAVIKRSYTVFYGTMTSCIIDSGRSNSVD